MAIHLFTKVNEVVSFYFQSIPYLCKQNICRPVQFPDAIGQSFKIELLNKNRVANRLIDFQLTHSLC